MISNNHRFFKESLEQQFVKPAFDSTYGQINKNNKFEYEKTTSWKTVESNIDQEKGEASAVIMRYFKQINGKPGDNKRDLKIGSKYDWAYWYDTNLDHKSVPEVGNQKFGQFQMDIFEPVGKDERQRTKDSVALAVSGLYIISFLLL